MPHTCKALNLPTFKAIQVAEIHRRTAPNSHSYHVTTTDGAQYILKAFPAEVAKERAFREAYASILGARLGISMAHWNVLQVDDQTCCEKLGNDKNSQLSGEKPHVGFYFGSRVLDGPGIVRSFLSDRLIAAHPLVARQLGWISIFDLWLANASLRLYAAIVHEGYPAHIYFHSHSSAFCPEIPAAFEERVALTYARACSFSKGARQVDHFLSAIYQIEESDLISAVCSVPEIWRDASLEAYVVALLRSRRDRLLVALKVGTATLGRVPVELLCDTANTTPRRRAELVSSLPAGPLQS